MFVAANKTRDEIRKTLFIHTFFCICFVIISFFNFVDFSFLAVVDQTWMMNQLVIYLHQPGLGKLLRGRSNTSAVKPEILSFCVERLSLLPTLTLNTELTCEHGYHKPNANAEFKWRPILMRKVISDVGFYSPIQASLLYVLLLSSLDVLIDADSIWTLHFYNVRHEVGLSCDGNTCSILIPSTPCNAVETIFNFNDHIEMLL